jgi:Txe/YoeB family toxin of Txe-Axe toxin-antitoxin module
MSEKSVVYDSTEKQYSVRLYQKHRVVYECIKKHSVVHDCTKNTM